MSKAYEIPFGRITLTPGVDLSDKRYALVTVNDDGDAVLASAGAEVVGVVQEPNKIGEPAQVVTHGVSFILLGETVKAGEPIASGAGGVGVKAGEDSAVVGICLVGGGAGDIGSILLK